MESGAPKRRRSSADNPFCNNSHDTDVSSPPQKVLPRPRKKAPNKKDSDVKSSSPSNTNSVPPESPTPFKEITFNEAFDDFELDGTERQNLLSDVQKVMARFQRREPDIEGIGEIEATLRDIGRFNDVLYLYVRFARQQPESNFNTESLSSLLSVSKQCNIKPPHTILTKIKSISIHKNASSRYGLAFYFVTRNNKDVDGLLLEKKFLGLKYTLKLLQSTIVKSDTILGKAKAGQTGAHLTPQEECNTTMTATKSFCLDAKLWLGITHRWLAYHIVYHLFSRDKVRCWTADNIFVFSIRIFAPSGKSRSDFLDPLVGVCLQFENSQDIKENQQELALIAADPSRFSFFGKSCLQNKKSEDKMKCIYNTFLSLKNTIQRKTIYFSLPPDSQWLLLKAYAFQLWLEQSRNQAMKKSVLQLLSVDNRKLPPPPQNNEANFTTPPLTQGLMSSKKRSISSLKEPSIATPVKDGFPPTPKNGPSPSTTTTPKGGLQALLSTRRTNDTQFLESSPDTHPVITFRDLQTAINDADCDWNNFRLFRTSQLDQFFTSYLIIRGEDRINFVSQASAIDVYSADNLHKLRHCRVNGNHDFYPTREEVRRQVNLNIGNEIEEFIDVSLKTLRIARERSSIFKEGGESIPPIHHIANLCRAVIQHGTCDNKRSPGQRRAFIGNGGLSFPNGKPALIVDGGFRKKLRGDATLSLEEILKTIGGLTEFLWETMDNIQQQASDPPLASNPSRHAAYANHLCTLLSMADCVSFEHITLVVSMIYPRAPSNVLEHVDAMNDSVDGYTRTGALTMCFRMDGGKNNFKLGLMFQVIGNFRRVIGEYMVRQHRKENECSPSLSPYSTSTVTYHPDNPQLGDLAYGLAQMLRSKASTKRIIFEGRNSKRSDGAQSYINNYSHSSKIAYPPYQYKVANFCDKEYASTHNIRRMKVLGHMEPPQDVLTQVNSFHEFNGGKLLLQYLRKAYGKEDDNMQSAAYHQQIISNQHGSEWMVFEGHVDKNFVHTAWFIPLMGTFFTFVAVPQAWNIPPHTDSEKKYLGWGVSTMGDSDRDKLGAFKEAFQQQAQSFMNESIVQLLVYYCSVGSFLSFPANICYHATVTIQTTLESPRLEALESPRLKTPHPDPTRPHMRDLLIVYPMEVG